MLTVAHESAAAPPIADSSLSFSRQRASARAGRTRNDDDNDDGDDFCSRDTWR